MNHQEGTSESVTNLDIGVKVKADLNPIVDATPRALSTIFNLVFNKRYAEAARKSLLSSAQNQVDAQKIINGIAAYDHKSGDLVESVKEREEIRKLVREAIQEEEISNLISCTVHAASTERESDGSEQISPEFLNRWRNEAKLMSDNETQMMWGRILSEEVNAPNAISLRTLDVIKNMSREEAVCFQEACKFIVFGKYLISSIGAGNPLPDESYEMLKDAGLIVSYQKGFNTSAEWLESQFTPEIGEEYQAYYLRVANLCIHVEKSLVNAPPKMNYLTLTKAGRELHRVVAKGIKADATVVGEVLGEYNPLIKHLLKWTEYISTDKNDINFYTIRTIF